MAAASYLKVVAPVSVSIRARSSSNRCAVTTMVERESLASSASARVVVTDKRTAAATEGPAAQVNTLDMEYSVELNDIRSRVCGPCLRVEVGRSVRRAVHGCGPWELHWGCWQGNGLIRPRTRSDRIERF